MKILILKIIEMLIGIVFLSVGVTLGIASGIGQTTSTSTSSSIAMALSIKVGTAMFLLYGLFLLLQLVMLGKKFKLSSLLQLVPIGVEMVILNYFKYDFPPFQNIAPSNYFEQVLVFIPGMVLISLGFTVVKWSNFLNFPPESFCSIISEKSGLRFGTVKILLDIVYVVAALLIFLMCTGTGVLEAFKNTDCPVREGTLIFAVCNGMLINFFTPFVQKIIKKAEGGQNE